MRTRMRTGLFVMSGSMPSAGGAAEEKQSISLKFLARADPSKRRNSFPANAPLATKAETGRENSGWPLPLCVVRTSLMG